MLLRTKIFPSPSGSGYEEMTMENKKTFTKESFWEEALKSDSILWWIIVNSNHLLEGSL